MTNSIRTFRSGKLRTHALFLSLLLCGLGEITSASAASLREDYEKTRQAWQKASTNIQAATDFSRAAFELADRTPSDAERKVVAQEGIDAAQLVLRNDPNSAAGHYFLALNIGQLARTKSLGALRLVDDMEKELKAAIAADPRIDHAGPDRSLGLLYLDAPGWPASIGSRSKARQHLRKAVEIEASFPENQICLVEYYLRTDERSQAEAQAIVAGRILIDQREKLTGSEWDSAWEDWDQRWEQIVKKLKVPLPRLQHKGSGK